MAEKPRSMLTTVDNPWSPFTHYDEWYAFDMAHGYNTQGFLARIAFTSVNLSEQDQRQDVERAIDEIVKYNVNGKFRKVFETDFETKVSGSRGD